MVFLIGCRLIYPKDYPNLTPILNLIQMKMKRILFIFFLFMFAATTNSYATYFRSAVKSPPPVTVTGQVKDTQGQPMAGVTVKVKGTNVGTQTDTNGKFQIQAPDDATIVFSFLGYADQSVPLNGQ